jgi:hypothetical protein
MTNKREFISVATPYILETFTVTDKEAQEHAVAFYGLLTEKLGSLTEFEAPQIRDAIDVHFGLRLSWRDPKRHDALRKRLDSEMHEARKRGLVK